MDLLSGGVRGEPSDTHPVLKNSYTLVKWASVQDSVRFYEISLNLELSTA